MQIVCKEDVSNAGIMIIVLDMEVLNMENTISEEQIEKISNSSLLENNFEER